MILNICEALLTIGLVTAMGWVCGMFSYFLDYCFWKGNIFDWYLPRLAKWAVRNFKPKVWQHIQLLEDGDRKSEWLISEAESLGIYKVLGGCAVCLNFHIALWSWVGIAVISGIPWYYGFAYILYSSYTIREKVKAVY